MKLFISIICIFAFAICALVTDCACAKPEWQNAVVSGRWIKPAWNEVQIHQSGKSTYVTSIYHPEEYLISVRTSTGAGNVAVSAWNYGEWNEGRECEVEYRVGKIMTYGYLSIR